MSPQRDPQQIRNEIEAMRRSLGATVEALANKADVKTRAKVMVGEKVGDVKASLAATKEDLVHRALEASPADAASAATELSRKAVESPLPASLAGAFAAGFMTGRMSAH